MSAHIENTATAVPPLPPAASPTAAAGAVPRKAEATPYAHGTTISSQMLGAKGTNIIDTPAANPAPIIAGRRPTVSTNRPAGPTAMVWATAATANATPVHDVG